MVSAGMYCIQIILNHGPHRLTATDQTKQQHRPHQDHQAPQARETRSRLPKNEGSHGRPRHHER